MSQDALFQPFNLHDLTLPIDEDQRKFRWPAPGPRPKGHPGIPDVV